MTSKKPTTKKSTVSTGKIVAVSAGIAALGAGAYYLLGPDAKKNQKKVGAWMDTAEKEISAVVTKAKKVSEPIYHGLVDGLVAKYAKQYNLKEKEITAFAKHLKSEWKGAKAVATKKIAATTKKVVSTEKSILKKVAKKVAPKKATKKITR